ncbi:uncharacterized protein TEOVI_000883100 [Trypanosoma equiperdum]|uniref:START domain containing protein n=1 Tax=Trypanosoma equiperdum TaxID=5694 RepID=A0A1G4I2L4_TRYEQ|nr:hypothetical protein, conserved [Trypanosoma equiperdum]
MPRTFYRRTATLCVSAAVATFTRRSSVWLQELSSPVSGSEQLLACMDFLDAHKGQWRIESTSFPPPAKLESVGNEPGLQVLRLSTTYTAVSNGGRGVPVLRLIGYLPGVAPEEVHRHMTDLKLRRQWDHNYTMFCRWDDGTRMFIDPLGLIRRPMEHVTRKTPVCEGDRCLLLPDVTSCVVDSGWFAHRVGNSLLEKFGIAERLFIYQRRSLCYTKQGGADANPLRMYDVLYSGDGEMLNHARTQSERFAEWMRSCSGGRKVSLVSMNYQHVLIVPISDVTAQVWKQPDRLSFGGSMVSEENTKAVYNLFMETTSHFKETRKLDGTLVVMTSANDASIPSHIPMWLQRKLTSVFSTYVYQQLLEAILSKRRDLNSEGKF